MHAPTFNVSLPTGFNDPYVALIRTLIYTEFPTRGHQDKAVLVDLLADEIIATGRTRSGPRPSAEAQVAIRAVIRFCVEAGRRIPFVIPWGSEKPNGSGVDVAELFALKTLKNLNDRISAHYAPGAMFNVRIEDVSAPHLFFERMDAARAKAAMYCYGFGKMIDILGLGHFIFPIKESDQCSEAKFNAEADKVLPHMESYLSNPDSEAEMLNLASIGWSNGIPPEMVAHFMGCYDKLYPGSKPAERIHRLARYFAGALARRNLKLSGCSPTWEGQYLELAFHQTIPGDIPRPRRIHYRTVPSHITSAHIAPWRGRGYLRIEEHRASVGLASWNDVLNVEPMMVRLERGASVINVQSDYMVMA